MTLTTERLRIYPATQSQMEDITASGPNDELKAAYTEMLEGCRENPDLWEWFSLWVIELLDGSRIGGLCFKGLNPDGTAEIGYGISEEYQCRGYATEAVSAVSGWAFMNPSVSSIEAEADPENIASIRVLEKCGFDESGETGNEGSRFVLDRKIFHA